ncbi:MAG: beta-lactamase family protein, partial [Chloroflexi bacterium]|nr:beta-lactamase family protein [Chloroflexota bacterium]
MKKLARIICWVMLLVFVLPAQVCGEALSLAEKADKIARSIVQDYAVTSVQYALSDKGRIVLSGNSGVFSKAENRLITANDMYGIGSTSKMFVTAAAMILWDQGLIDLDEPIVSYIPEFSMADERYKEITPRMLMNHSSGLYGSSLANAFLFDDNSTMAHDTLLEKLSTQRLKAVPGEFSEYCNDGFSLLEILVERVSGISYTDFLAVHFIKPLGLVNTKTPMDDFDKAKRLVKTYIPPFEGALPNDTVNVLGTGGLYSTAEELCAFARVLMGNRPEILSEQATLMMQNEEYKRGMWVDAEGDNYIGCYGLGWDTVHSFPFSDYGIQVLTKGGDTQLFHSSLVVIPALDIAMAVVSSGGASIIDYAFAANILQEYLLETGVIQQITPHRTATAP